MRGLASVGWAVAGAAWVALAVSWWWVIDDAYISFRYARQLVRGHGLVFNVGESPPVEGFSNLLWVLGAAGVEAIGARPARVMPVVSLATGLGVVAATGWIARRRLGLDGRAAAVAMGAVALAPSVVVWSTGGLATMPAALALLGLVDGWWLASDRRGLWRGAACGALLVLLRTEGVGWVVVVGGLGAAGLSPSSRCDLLRSALLPGVVWLAMQGVRAWWFEAWVSNTAAAKLSGSWDQVRRGLRYILGWLAASPGHLALIVAAAVALGRRRDRASLAIALMMGGPIAFAVLVGGDFMAFWRLLVPALPFVALGAAIAVRDGRALAGMVVLGVALLPLPLLDVHPVPQSVRRTLDVRHNTVQFRSERAQWRFMVDNTALWVGLGRGLRATLPPGSTWVTGAVGAAGYHAPDVVILDRFGLVTPEVAERPAHHARVFSPGHDRAVPVTWFLDRSPDVMVAVWTPTRAGLRAWPDLVDRTWRTMAPRRYAPEPSRVPGRRGWLLLLRRQADPDTAQATWAAWDATVPWLFRGRLDPRRGPGGGAGGGRSAPPDAAAAEGSDSGG